MTGTDWIAIIGAVGTNLAILVGLIYHKRETEQKNRLLWEMELRQGQTAALAAKLATKDSPFLPLPEVFAIFEQAGLVEQLRSFYAEEGEGKPDWELREMMEKKFGALMLEAVERPNTWPHAAAMALAVGVARGPDYYATSYDEAEGHMNDSEDKAANAA